jgi:chaperonin GroES
VKIIPTGNRILVKPDPVEEVSKGGIVLPLDQELYQQASQRGTLISQGEIAWKEFANGRFSQVYAPYAEIGDRVVYKRYSGAAIRDDDTDEEFFIMNDNDVIAVIKDDK